MTRIEHSRAARRRGELTHDRGSLRLSPAIDAQRRLNTRRARSTTPAPREPFVASAADAPTDGPSVEGEDHAAARQAVDAGRPTRGDAQRLLDLLSAAHGRPVTFATLARGGVARSAAVTCQLELVGAPVQRVYEHGRPVGARLDTHERRRPRQVTTSSLPAGYVQRPATAPLLAEPVLQGFDDGRDRRERRRQAKVRTSPSA